MPLTIKVKAKRYPLGHYAIAGLLAVLGSAFWAWIAHTVFGFGLSMAMQVFFVFSGVQLLFLPIMYFAYDRQFRNHSSRAVQKMASCFASSFAFTVLYFIAQFPLGSPTVKAITITISAMSILLGAIVSIFLIRYEFE
ncbi:MAG: hypothetical protein WBV69_16110 [Candidatus Sulfotelmatobacter sp.]